MNMLIEELQLLSANPWSWVVVGLMGLFTAYSVMLLMACPYAHGKAEIGDSDVHRAKSEDFNAGGRFALLMIGGVLLTLAGLFMIAKGISPALALAALVVGIVLIQTEPAQLLIREAKRNVIACRDASEGEREGAQDRLKASHRSLAVTNVVLLAGVTAGLVAF